MTIPFLNLEPMHSCLRSEMLAAFSNVYDSNWFITGRRLADFETAYAKFSQTNFAIGVSNGLDALHLALKALGVGPGDEVIVPSNTFIATVLAVSYVGASPVFVEPDLATYNISPTNIEQAITSRTRAIIAVHLYGQACDMESIMVIASKHGLSVIEDNAQAHGAAFKGKITGSWGHANAASFYPGKNLGALGDGGVITCNDRAVLDRVSILRNYGSRTKYIHEVIGYNMRLDEMQAAFLLIKLAHLNNWNCQRRDIAQCYLVELDGISDLVLPFTHPDSTHVYHCFVVRTKERDRLQAYLTANGISTLIHYPIPPHLQGAYTHLGFRKGAFPIAEEISRSCLSLPMWPGLAKEQITHIAARIRDFFHQ